MQNKLELESHREWMPLLVVLFDVRPGHAFVTEASEGFDHAFKGFVFLRWPREESGTFLHELLDGRWVLSSSADNIHYKEARTKSYPIYKEKSWKSKDRGRQHSL